jgi:alpha-D-ribose 1-methylphosphonate 5-triphosphate synthase subunit PhnI
MYVAVKGGEKAIDNAHNWLAEERRGDPAVPELTLEQIKQQLTLAVDRVMSEGSLYDADLAALAIKQARGDLVEAIFLLRAYRTTLPRLGYSRPLDTTRMQVRRRISATYKDIPGGQILGPTFDYSHRLLDFSLAAAQQYDGQATRADTDDTSQQQALPRVVDILNDEGLIEAETADDPQREVADLTREPLTLPAGRDMRLQNLARADEGYLLALAYSSQRGFGNNHPFAGEIRLGEVSVEIEPEELGFAVDIGDISITECQMINQFKGSEQHPPQFTRGYGLSFGHCERKAMSMALVDRALRCQELGEAAGAPAQDEEFVLAHSDSMEASGFVQHLKLPHYVDFQGELESIRKLRRHFEQLRNHQQQGDTD